MKLYVTGRYRSSHGSYEPGQVLDVTEADAEFLLRDSPSSFAREKASPHAPVVSDEAPDDDMSEELATGLDVPDRRARGGRVR